jgi:hypothetical protein
MKPQLQDALNKVTVDLVIKLNHGEEIALNEHYTIYKYCSDDVVVISDDEEEEVLQVMVDDLNVEYEVLDESRLTDES